MSARGQSVEDAEKQLAASYAKMQSGTAKTRTTQDFTLPTGERVMSDSTATVEWMRKGDAVLYRSEVTVTQKQMGGDVPEISTQSKFTSVHDGEFHYVLSDNVGDQKAQKFKPDPAQYGEPKAVLDNLRRYFEIKLLPDEKVEGFDCFAFELTPKNPETSPARRTLAYFRKDIGLNIKNVGFDKDGKQAFLSVTSDVEINVPVSADHFVFKLPAGMTLEDKTK